MSIRIPQRADREVQDGLRDADQAINDLAITMGKLRAEIEEVRGLLPVVGATPSHTNLGDVSINGILRVAGATTLAAGTLTAPGQLGGFVGAIASGTAGTSTAQRTLNLLGSVSGISALSADTIYCRRIVPAGQYCELYVFDNASAQTFTDQNTFYQWTTGWVQSEIAGMAGNTTTGTITVKEPGLYRMSLSCTAFTGSANQDYEFAFYITGATANDHRGHISFLTTSEKKGVTLTGITTLAAGATVDVRARNVTSAAKTMTIEDANFSVNLLFSNGTGA